MEIQAQSAATASNSSAVSPKTSQQSVKLGTVSGEKKSFSSLLNQVMDEPGADGAQGLESLLSQGSNILSALLLQLQTVPKLSETSNPKDQLTKVLDTISGKLSDPSNPSDNLTQLLGMISSMLSIMESKIPQNLTLAGANLNLSTGANQNLLTGANQNLLTGANVNLSAASITPASLMTEQIQKMMDQLMTGSDPGANNSTVQQLLSSFKDLLSLEQVNQVSQKPLTDSNTENASAVTGNNQTSGLLQQKSLKFQRNSQPNSTIQTVSAKSETNSGSPRLSLVHGTGLERLQLLNTVNNINRPTLLTERQVNDSNLAGNGSQPTLNQLDYLPSAFPSKESGILQQLNQMTTSPQPINSAQFAQEMSQMIVKNFKVTQANGFSEAKISLVPQHLGQVDVRISMHDGQIVAQFLAQTIAGKESIENQLSQLKTALQNQGLQVDKLEVSQNNNLQSGMFQGQRQQQQSQQFVRTVKGSSSGYEDSNDVFSVNLQRETLLRTAALGGSINVTA